MTPEYMMSAEDKIVAARFMLMKKHPFFSTIALHLVPSPFRIPWKIMEVTVNRILHYNPVLMKDFGVENTLFALCACVIYPVLKFFDRVQTRDPAIFSLAMAFKAHQIIEMCAIPRPKEFVRNVNFDNLLAEQIYDMLVQHHQNKGSFTRQAMEKIKPQDIKDGSKDFQRTPEEEALQNIYAMIAMLLGVGVQYNKSAHDIEPDQSNSFVIQGEDAGIGSTPDEWKRMVARAQQAALDRGTLPAGLKLIIDEIQKPKLDWVSLLFRWIHNNANLDDFSMRIPSRHSPEGEFYPSLQPQFPRIYVVIDSSGSTVYAKLIERFIGECSAIFDLYPFQTRCIYIDAEVQIDVEMSSVMELVKNAKGGGGTTFQPLFDKIRDEHVAPDLMVFFSDLAADNAWMEKNPPSYPVLWVCPQQHGTVPFGECIELDPYAKEFVDGN